MMNNVITTVNFEYHIQMLKQRFRRRRVTGVITQSRIRLEEGGDPNEVVAELMAELSKVVEPDRQNLRRFDDIAETLIARIEVGDIPEPIPTGLSKLDTPMGGGLARSDLVVVAGRPSMGKSAFSSQIAVNVAKSGKKVLVFPVEMNAESVAIRILSSASGLEPAVLRNTRFQCDWSKVRNAISPISKSDLWFDDDPALTSNKVILVAKDLSARLGGLDLVVVDYLQILSDVPNENRNNYLGNVTKMFKTLARQLNCPVILVSQLNRQVENRRGNRPTMADLRDTGELENHADGILLLHRPHYYDESADEHETHLIIAKQRNGVTDTVPLHWDSNHLRFSCVDSRY
jgi:replicative DNA helicase